MIYVTSDMHYFHTNLCKGISKWTDKSGCRDFETIEQMNEAIINGINSTVGEDDELYHLGDWSFGGRDKIEEFRNKIKCKTIYLIRGNHDIHVDSYKHCFKWIKNYYELRIKKYPMICMMHYPIASWNNCGKGSIHLHGHTHGNYQNHGKSMDVGADTNNYKPYSIDEIMSIMSKKEIKVVDHH